MKVIDFFSGCGGASEGLRQAGMKIALGLDFDKDAANSYQANFPEAVFIEGDIRDVSENELIEIIKTKNSNSEPLLLTACAPCQPFSSQNKTKIESDSRRTLLDETHRFISCLQPDYLFIENVPGIQKINENEDGPYKRFINFITSKGYHSIQFIAKAEEYGVPQRRKRFVLIASKLGQITQPKITHGEKLQTYATVRDYIGNYPKIAAGERHPDDKWHTCPILKEINISRIKSTPEGGDRRYWPAELINECHKNHKGHMDTYGRMSWDLLAPTLTTKCYSYSNGRFGHPDINQDRAISIREASRLQTFPENFFFKGSLISAARQIGNAVPCEMAKQFGLSILEHYKEYKKENG